MYDYFLDGKDNFAADRAAAEQIVKLFPDTRESARANRAFLRRAVRHLVESGIEQIVDLGAGLPTQGDRARGARRLPRCGPVRPPSGGMAQTCASVLWSASVQ